MFGIGFTELLLIAIIAILFLGPDKLPGALVEMAKFIKSVKRTIGDAKSSLEEEMKIADLKEEALNYKRQLTEATEELKGFKNIHLDELEDTMKMPLDGTTPSNTNETVHVTTQVESKNETVTFKKKPKAEGKSKNETKSDV